MSKYAEHDRYVDPVSGVLINRLGIKDEAQLEQVEVNFAALQSAALAENPIREPLSLQAFQLIHRKLFGDVYSWAGEFRDVDISKGGTRFAHWRYIKSNLEALFAQLQVEKELYDLNLTDFSCRSAFFMAEINAIHPFREGNGRTQRELLSQLAYRAGYAIKWQSMSTDDILQATILSYQNKRESLEQLILKNLHKETI